MSSDNPVTQDNADVISFIRKPILRNVLKYHVGQVMFCPACKACLDWRRAISVDVLVTSDERGPRIATSHCMCTKCWDKDVHARFNAAIVRLNTKHHGEQHFALDVTDGRRLK